MMSDRHSQKKKARHNRQEEKIDPVLQKLDLENAKELLKKLEEKYYPRK